MPFAVAGPAAVELYQNKSCACTGITLSFFFFLFGLGVTLQAFADPSSTARNFCILRAHSDTTTICCRGLHNAGFFLSSNCPALSNVDSLTVVARRHVWKEFAPRGEGAGARVWCERVHLCF